MNDFKFYFTLGLQHILTIEALDHILFIAALSSIYQVKEWRKVLILVTAFTVGHTATLILSSQNMIEVNSGLVEFLIPCTIICTALINIFRRSFTTKTVNLNYLMALFFGLIHGLAFANVLQMIIATDQKFALSMFGFSVGIETGQILIVILMLLLAYVFVEQIKLKRQNWILIISVLVLVMAAAMLVERWPF